MGGGRENFILRRHTILFSGSSNCAHFIFRLVHHLHNLSSVFRNCSACICSILRICHSSSIRRGWFVRRAPCRGLAPSLPCERLRLIHCAPSVLHQAHGHRVCRNLCFRWRNDVETWWPLLRRLLGVGWRTHLDAWRQLLRGRLGVGHVQGPMLSRKRLFWNRVASAKEDSGEQSTGNRTTSGSAGRHSCSVNAYSSESSGATS